MPLLCFNKATDPAAPDDLRINPAAVLYVEASRPDLIGQTTIHLLGQGTSVNAVTQSLATVVSAIGSLIGATRHYLAPPPDDGPPADDPVIASERALDSELADEDRVGVKRGAPDLRQ